MDEQIRSLVNAIGGIAEMSYAFYKAMVNAGASEEVAFVGMQSFIESLMGGVIGQVIGGKNE